jgi:hypothetical protein
MFTIRKSNININITEDVDLVVAGLHELGQEGKHAGHIRLSAQQGHQLGRVSAL